MPGPLTIGTSRALLTSWDVRQAPGFVAFLDGLSLRSLGVGASIDAWTPLWGDVGYTVTASGSARPAVASTANGATFDGTGDRLDFSGVALNFTRNIGAVTIYLAVSYPTTTIQRLLWISRNVSGSSRINISRTGSSTLSLTGRRLDSDAAPLGVAATIASSTVIEVRAAVYNWSAAALVTYSNGVQSASTSSFQTPGLTSDTASAEFSLSGTSEFFAGTTYGVVLCRGVAHDAGTVAQTSAWLRARYGI